MGRTEGKNGSFMAIRMRILKKNSSMSPSWTWKLGPEAMPKFLIVVIYLLCYSIAGHSLGALMYLKT